MNALLTAVPGIGLLAVPLAGSTQPALEPLRFDPPQVCPKDTFRWGFAYRDLPGGLAAVRDITLEGLRLFHGTADDLAPVAPCRAYVERLRRAGADAQIAEYPGAHHGFDRPSDAPPRHLPREQNASRCVWEERPEGHLVTRDTGQPISLGDPCVLRGGTIGADPAAYRAALQAVKALLAP
jgi:hypothetical protein